MLPLGLLNLNTPPQSERFIGVILVILHILASSRLLRAFLLHKVAKEIVWAPAGFEPEQRSDKLLKAR